MKFSPSAEGIIGRRRPKVAGGGDNVPLDILRVLSDWVGILEARETVPGPFCLWLYLHWLC
jgi:ion channel-forming bestrophin family protein